jgi:hypothetical protein
MTTTPSGLRRLLTVALAGACLALAVPAAPAHAQLAGSKPKIEMKPPTAGTEDKPPVIMMYVVLLALAAAVVGAALIPTKRGHQD